MFSPRAEYCPIPGWLWASSRSRWTKRPVRAIWPDQLLASFARSSLQASGARPRALRSALARLNRSRAIASAVVDGCAGAVYTWAMLLAQSTYWLTEVAGRALAATLGSGWMRFRRAISAACAAATALRRRSTRMPGRPLRARSWLIRATSRSWSPACTGAAAGRLAASWALLRGRMRPGPAVTSNSRLMTSGTAMTSAIRPLPRRPAAWEASRAYAGASPRRRERDGASSSALLLVVCTPQSWVRRCSAPGSPWNASALRPWPGCAPQPWLGDWSALHSGVPAGSPPRGGLGTCPVLHGWLAGSSPRGGPEAGWTPQGGLWDGSVPREGPGACRVSQGSLRKGSWP